MDVEWSYNSALGNSTRGENVIQKIGKVLLYTVGWAVIVGIPAAFFTFGWKAVELDCRRGAAGERPACRVTESFAMGLYQKTSVVSDVMRVGYRTGSAKQTSARGGTITVHPSSLVFDTAGGEVVITHAGGSSKEGELILKAREFLNQPESLAFHYKASLRNIFGYVGLVGTAGLLFIFIATGWHQIKKRVWPERRA